MRIQSINQFQTNKCLKSTNITNNTTNLNLSEARDKAVIEFVEDTKRNNASSQKLALASMILCFTALPIVALSILKNGKKSSNKDSVQHVVQVFQSLKNDSSIPTLDTCKSIDKNLRIFLVNHVNYLKATPEEIKKAGVPKPEKKLLLFGEPGTGKSFFAKIFAKTIDAEYMEIKYSDLNSKFVGEHLENMTLEFENILSKAKMEPNKNFVVVFNEIDAMIQSPHKLINSYGSHSAFKIEERSVFINFVDEITNKVPNVIIIGTTNILPKKSTLDTAIISRFKNLISVDFPSAACLKEAIIDNLSRITETEKNDKFINNNIKHIETLAADMEKQKYSYRDLEFIINQAKRFYLDDYMKDKNAKFNIQYLVKAFKNHSVTDGGFAET